MLPATGLVALFVFLTGRSYLAHLRGEPPSEHGCGCFGRLVERSPAEAFWQDLAMMLPPLLLAWVGRPSPNAPIPVRRGLAAALLTVGVLVFTGFAPDLPLDDLATRLERARRLDDNCLGEEEEERPGDMPVIGASTTRVCLHELMLHPRLLEWDKERYYVVMADVTDAHFLNRLKELNDYATAETGLPLVVLSPSPEQAVEEFTVRHGAAFDPLPAPPALLRPLYRRLPRSFLVEGGRVVETYPDLPPLGNMGGGGSGAEGPDDTSDE
jgi:hypothetical protein